MSELINNKQKRIEVMKSLIRQLHQGVAEDRIRAQLETLLDEADYNDVFVMEVQLIQEGIPAEVVQDLCDTHTRVLKKHLDLQETPQTIPGHPVHTFIEENRELSRITTQVRQIMGQIASLPADTDVSVQMGVIHQLLNDLMDVEKHYRRKENLLFPYFEKNNLPGPPSVMWGKHDEVREMLKTTLGGLQEVSQFTAGEANGFNQFSVAMVLDGIDDMIYKEEKILFPTALDLLNERDWYEIYLQSDELGYCLYAPQAVEKISYQMPTFYLHGNLVHFAAQKHHIGFYPAPSGIAHFAKELSAYKTSKGAAQFPLDRPIPYDLIRQITVFRVQENLMSNKSGKKSSG